MRKQISINLTADEGHVADALRQLANFVEETYSEETGYPRQYESNICCAELTYSHQ